MNAYLLEPFLTQYYLLEALCGSFLSSARREEVFYDLAQVFCLGQSPELEAYFHDSGLPHFSQIRNLADYERLQRTIEFAQRSGRDMALTERDRMILAQKRNAMVIREALFRQEMNMTCQSITATLTTQAMNGNVDAMALLGYLEHHGICMCADPHSAMKRIRLCAKWNSLFGNLMGIAWDEQPQGYYDTLYTVLRSASQKQVMAHILSARGFEGTCHKNPVARIVERAFGLGIIQRGSYHQTFAKVAFSQVISLEDKEKLLLNTQRGAVEALSDIPFDLSWEETVCFRPDCARELPLQREREVGKILQNICLARTCPAETYRPLLVVTPEAYLAQMYENMLYQGFAGSQVVQLDAGTLTDMDFAPGRGHVLLRFLAETRSARTVFMIRDCQELSGGQLEELMKLLDGAYRRRFRLFQPAVSMNLSGLMFVLLSSQRNSAVMRLAELCDTVWADPIAPQEKDAMVADIYQSQAKAFGWHCDSLDSDCAQYLAGFDARQVRQILDGAIRSAIYAGCSHVTMENIEAVCQEHKLSVQRKGFGYTGGRNHGEN